VVKNCYSEQYFILVAFFVLNAKEIKTPSAPQNIGSPTRKKLRNANNKCVAAAKPLENIA